ncbi:MAG TPA: S8 family serine peptidase [Thermoanaerobaculia bacterium]|jgi:subtilisin family serine protease
MPGFPRRTVATVLALTVAALSLAPTTVARAGDLAEPSLSVFFVEDLADIEIGEFAQRHGIVPILPIEDQQLVTFTASDLPRALLAVRNDPLTLAASEATYDHTFNALYPQQWYLRNVGQSYAVGLARLIVTSLGIDQLIDAFPATAGKDIGWEAARQLPVCAGQTCSGAGVTVGVIDSGVDARHPDLAGAVSIASKSLVGGTVDDSNGHGTFIAGLIAARDDASGMVGVAPSASVLAVETSIDGSSSTATNASGIRYAVQNGATVLNLSFGSGAQNDVMRAAINEVTAPPYNAIVVAAAGNDAAEKVNYPASYSHVVSVSGTDSSGDWAEFSTWNDAVDVAAPGALILSLLAKNAPLDCTHSGYEIASIGLVLGYEGPNDCGFIDGNPDAEYKVASGTSYAAPLVAGAAALAKQKWPTLTSDEFEMLVRATAEDAGPPGPDVFFGAGSLSLARLLAFNFPPSVPPGQIGFTAPTIVGDGAMTTQLFVRPENKEGEADIVSVTMNLAAVGGEAEASLSSQGGLLFQSAPFSIPSSIAPGSYSVPVAVRDSGGATATASAPLVIVATAAEVPATHPGPQMLAPGTRDVAFTIARPSSKRERITRKKTLMISGTAGLDASTIEVNGEPAEIDLAGKAWGARVKLKEGKNKLRIESFDVTRTASSSQDVTVTLDTKAPPAVTDLQVARAGSKSTVTWSAPKEGGVSGYHVYRMQGGRRVELTTTRTLSATIEGDGPFAITAEDRAGNEGPAASTAPAAIQGSANFRDVPTNHYAAVAIESLRARGVVGGNGGVFAPDAAVTRAEFAKMLALVFGKAPSMDAAAIDVTQTHPLAGFVGTAMKLGWARGEAGKFYPDRALTRMEAARMLVRAAAMKIGTSERFSDLTGEDDRLATTLLAAGILAGRNGSFEPARPLTRGESATILYNASR